MVKVGYLALILCGASAVACDPCSGVAGCTTEPHLTITGRLLNELTERPEAAAAIDFIRTSGVGLTSDSVRTFTNDQGVFMIDIASASIGDVRGNVGIRPRDGGGYRVVDLQLTTSNRRGEAHTFKPWSTVPQLRDYAVIWLRGAPVQLATGVEIEFRQTGGVGLLGLSGGTFRTSTDANGMAPLFGFQAQPVDAGDVVGELTVHFPDPIGPKIRQNVRVRATPIFRKQLELIQIGVGPSLEYHIAAVRRGHLSGVAGVQVEFQRTAGISVTNPNWTSLTDGSGRVVFPGRPNEAGTITGNIRITPPAPWRSFERTAQTFTTFDEDGARLALTLEVGPGVGGFVRVHANGTPLKGVEVEFLQTAGVQLDPPLFKAVSNDTGYVYLTTAANNEGEVVADLTIHPPVPHRSFTIRGVRMQAYDGDAPATPVIIGEWNVAQPPASSLRRAP